MKSNTVNIPTKKREVTQFLTLMTLLAHIHSLSRAHAHVATHRETSVRKRQPSGKKKGP